MALRPLFDLRTPLLGALGKVKTGTKLRPVANTTPVVRTGTSKMAKLPRSVR